MYAEPGFYPYTAELQFYQPVQLMLGTKAGTSAATWHSSIVGAITKNCTNFIAEGALGLVDQFKNDFQRAHQ
ncbi:MAG: hypothetical protein FH748_00130 [Balneolaceae bacterium]|nr:hypothetical protein [Balneolaceae bacterium]